MLAVLICAYTKLSNLTIIAIRFSHIITADIQTVSKCEINLTHVIWLLNKNEYLEIEV